MEGATVSGVPHRRYLLLQVRDADDPMRAQEVVAFSRELGLDRGELVAFDLLAGAPSRAHLADATAVLIGGSGAYSVVRGGPWLRGALDTMEWLVASAKPVFASCWGFQAIARATGGRVVTDHGLAEVGIVPLHLTPAGRRDPVFGRLGRRFHAVMGHEDIVTDLPPEAVSLVRSETVENEALTFPGKPIYATQFHPELQRGELIRRLARYPAYVPLTGYGSLAELDAKAPRQVETGALLRRFERALGEAWRQAAPQPAPDPGAGTGEAERSGYPARRQNRP